jgi:hypothetical protein
MLYDSAQLTRAYLHVWQVTGSELVQIITDEILDYVMREMRDPQGGFTACPLRRVLCDPKPLGSIKEHSAISVPHAKGLWYPRSMAWVHLFRQAILREPPSILNLDSVRRLLYLFPAQRLTQKDKVI